MHRDMSAVSESRFAGGVHSGLTETLGLVLYSCETVAGLTVRVDFKVGLEI